VRFRLEVLLGVLVDVGVMDLRVLVVLGDRVGLAGGIGVCVEGCRGGTPR
jgi:hypothetical protein